MPMYFPDLKSVKSIAGNMARHPDTDKRYKGIVPKIEDQLPQARKELAQYFREIWNDEVQAMEIELAVNENNYDQKMSEAIRKQFQGHYPPEMTREDMYKLQKKEDGYWLIINLPKHKQSGVFRLSTNLHNEKAENLGFLKGILDTAIEEQETRPTSEPSKEAERAYRKILDYFADDLFAYSDVYEGDQEYTTDEYISYLNTLAQAAGIKIDGGNEDG